MFDEEPDGDPHGECAAEIHRLMADLAAAQRELAAYREPTLEDAWALCESLCDAGIGYSDAISSIDEVALVALKQLGFYRKVQP